MGCFIVDIVFEKKSITDEIIRYLLQVKHKWFEIGVLLGVPLSDLEVINDMEHSPKEKIEKSIDVSIKFSLYDIHT